MHFWIKLNSTWEKICSRATPECKFAVSLNTAGTQEALEVRGQLTLEWILPYPSGNTCFNGYHHY